MGYVTKPSSKWRFYEDLIKNSNEKSHERYFLEVDVQYPEILQDVHNDLPFLTERI